VRVIFLDVDGVLNAECDFGGHKKPNPFVITAEGFRYCGICKTHVKYLKKIVAATNAKIVLVSSWKRDYEDYIRNGYINMIGKYLYNKLRKQGLEIYDTTVRYMSGIWSGHRGFEIESWLKDHENIEG
jgi:histidinol phosphatase-like enzyme